MKKDEREKLEALRDELDELLENDEQDTAERVKPQRSVFRMRFFRSAEDAGRRPGRRFPAGR